MLHTIYFIYGLCVMFYFMMSWLFFHKDKELLSRLVAVLMLVIGVQCLKNLYFIKPINDPNEIRWMMTIASDVVDNPFIRLYPHRTMQSYKPHPSYYHRT